MAFLLRSSAATATPYHHRRFADETRCHGHADLNRCLAVAEKRGHVYEMAARGGCFRFRH